MSDAPRGAAIALPLAALALAAFPIGTSGFERATKGQQHESGSDAFQMVLAREQVGLVLLCRAPDWVVIQDVRGVAGICASLRPGARVVAPEDKLDMIVGLGLAGVQARSHIHAVRIRVERVHPDHFVVAVLNHFKDQQLLRICSHMSSFAPAVETPLFRKLYGHEMPLDRQTHVNASKLMRATTIGADT